MDQPNGPPTWTAQHAEKRLRHDRKSQIDEPSKTLKAGDHGVPGGENMIRFNDDSIRYFTVREAARIQTFPDDYHISGAWSECMRQIGNAVPVTLAEVVSKSVYQALSPNKSKHSDAA